MTWYTKVRRPGGGDSVLSVHESHAAALEAAGRYNEPYQTDDAYVEAYDASKAAEWPTPKTINRIIEQINGR